VCRKIKKLKNLNYEIFGTTQYKYQMKLFENLNENSSIHSGRLKLGVQKSRNKPKKFVPEYTYYIKEFE